MPRIVQGLRLLSACWRGLLAALALLGFMVVGIPLQTLAVARGWRLAKWIPGFFHRTMCLILRVRVRVRGSPADASPLLIVANHVSWVDILALSTREPVCFLAKREMRSWPVFGRFAVLQGSVFVDRARLADLPRVNAEIAARLRQGDRLVLFAESTTTDGTTVLRFRPAHFAAAEVLLAHDPDLQHVTIQPTALAYAAADGRTEIAWYGDMTLLPHLLRVLRGGPYVCAVCFGEPILFDRGTDRKTAAKLTEQSVRRLKALAADMLTASPRHARNSPALFS